MRNIKVIDLFCGAGGFSSGAVKAQDRYGNFICEVIAGVNHDKVAIVSHTENHPETEHFVEDVRDNSVIERLAEKVRLIRLFEPDAIIVLHASLECTHFSIAKGGDSRDPDSRSLAEYMPLYISAIQPDFFTVENVKEFLTWGDLSPKTVKEDGYVLLGNQTDQKKFIGNSVVPVVAQKLIEAINESIKTQELALF